MTVAEIIEIVNQACNATYDAYIYLVFMDDDYQYNIKHRYSTLERFKRNIESCTLSSIEDLLLNLLEMYRDLYIKSKRRIDESKALEYLEKYKALWYLQIAINFTSKESHWTELEEWKREHFDKMNGGL